MKEMIRFSIFAMVLVLAASCNGTIEVDDGNYAEDVEGVYTITAAMSNSAVYENTIGDTIRVTRVDDTHVDMVVEFSAVGLSDLEISNVVCSDASNGDIDLDREFSNAVLVGFYKDNDMTFNLDYDGDDFVEFDATK